MSLSGCVLGQAATQPQLEQLWQQAHQAEEKGQYAQAERIYRQALTVAPNDLETLKRLGLVFQTALKFDESIRLFQRVLKANPQFPEVNLFEGISYLAKNDFAQARESFERELKTSIPHPKSRYYLALAMRSSGLTEEAIAQLDLAVRDNPKDADALYQLVRMHKEAAIAEMSRAAQGNPEDADAHQQSVRRHQEAARHALERLKEADPDSFQWHALMGEADADQERFPEALKEYRAALARRPDALGLHYSIGAALWTQSQYDEAAQEFHKALREDPKNPLTNLYLGGIAVRQQRYKEAMSFLEIARAGAAQMPLVHLLMGRCFLELKQLDKAKAELLATVEANPDDSQAHYLLARVYRESGDAAGRARELELFEKLMKAENAKRVAGGKP